jgi:hypothetical protein
MISPWKTPLPLESYSSAKVVIYFYNDNQWVPIKHCYLLKAVELYQNTKTVLGKEIFLFPPGLDPNIFSN